MQTTSMRGSRAAAIRTALGAAIALLGALAAGGAGAQRAAATADANLKEVVVTATRTERVADEVPASVSVRDREALDERLVDDVRDLVRDEPGVTVRRAPARFVAVGPQQTGRAGNEGFNIRGIEGNRVLTLIDGLRLPNASSSFGRGDYVDATFFCRVEILRGPASALYGSDGLAGAVSIVTPDPADLLARSRADRHLGWRIAYDGSDAGLANTGLGGGALRGFRGAGAGHRAARPRTGQPGRQRRRQRHAHTAQPAGLRHHGAHDQTRLERSAG